MPPPLTAAAVVDMEKSVQVLAQPHRVDEALVRHLGAGTRKLRCGLNREQGGRASRGPRTADA